ncbi:MAG: hypothetical protein V7633_3411, partial [Pseudonocardia sp.]
MSAAAAEPANTSAADTTARWLGGIANALAVIGPAIALAVALRFRRAGRSSGTRWGAGRKAQHLFPPPA